jgi:hypothetical protein
MGTPDSFVAGGKSPVLPAWISSFTAVMALFTHRLHHQSPTDCHQAIQLKALPMVFGATVSLTCTIMKLSSSRSGGHNNAGIRDGDGTGLLRGWW